MLRPAIGLALPGTLITAVVTGPRRLVAVRLLDARGPAARRDHLLDGRRRGVLAAARRRAAQAAGAHARGRGRASTTRSPCCSCSGSSTGSSIPATASPTCSGCSCSSSGSASWPGVAVGWLAARAFRRVRLSSPGLYPVASLATAALAFGAADTLGGSGFLAVYLAGLALGSANIPAKRTVTAFHEGLAWVAQLDDVPHARPARVPGRARRGRVATGTLLALVVVFVARPLATALGTLGIRLQRAREGLARLGRAARRGPRRARDLPRDRGRPAVRDVLQHRLLRRAALDGAAGHDDRRRRAPARGHVRRAVRAGRRSSRSARCASSAPTSSSTSSGAGDAAAGARLRDLGHAARRARLADRARRGGAAAARLDAAGGRRPPARARPPRGRATSCRSCSSAGARARCTSPCARRAPTPAAFPSTPRGRGRRPTATRRTRARSPATPVVEHLRTRRDVPGALVILADGRFAVTGPILMMGPPGAGPGPGAPAADRGDATTPSSPGGRR